MQTVDVHACYFVPYLYTTLASLEYAICMYMYMYLHIHCILYMHSVIVAVSISLVFSSRYITLMDTLRYIDPGSLINRVVYCLDDELASSRDLTSEKGHHVNHDLSQTSNDDVDTKREECCGGVAMEQCSDGDEKETCVGAESSSLTPPLVPSLSFRATSESCNLRKVIQVSV